MLCIKLSLMLVLPVQMAVAATCSTKQVERIRLSMGKDISKATRCPDATWKELFFRGPTIQRARRPVIVYDVGCNKAFDALSTLRSLTLNPQIDLRKWIKQTGFKCGMCHQCTNAMAKIKGSPKEVRLFCMEPMPDTYSLLLNASLALGMDKLGLQVANAAFTSRADATKRDWKGAFPASGGQFFAGQENIGLGNALKYRDKCEQCHLKDVPLMVLDDHVRQESVDYVDILSIDTEGNDPLVLEGAMETLRKGVGYVEFEYSRKGQWSVTKLIDVVKKLHLLGFVCYWLGVGRLWQITGCWHHDYNVRQWSNIGCVHVNKTEWHGIMHGISERTLKSRTKGTHKSKK